METRQAKSLTVQQIIQKLDFHKKTIREDFNDNLSDDKIREFHETLVIGIGENYCQREFRNFCIDSRNEKILQFLLYYFNGCSKALDVFPDSDYALHKNILLIGPPGTGKTMIMQIFSDYLKMTNNPNQFHNISITQMANYYKLHGNIDRYTYNESETTDFDGKPFNLCLNDIGIDLQQKSFGTDLDSIIDEFLFARYEIFQNHRKRTHLTSNMVIDEFKSKYEERLMDRFKNYNVLALTGNSRRK